MIPSQRLAWLPLIVCLVACGGSGGGGGRSGVVGTDDKGVCTNELDPCGGDLSGVWQVKTTCFVTLPECVESSITSMQPTTTFSFQSNGKLQLDATGAASTSTVQDLACTGAASCADLADANATCQAQGASSCLCTASGTVANSSTLDYAVSGNKLTLTVGTDSVEYSFCAKAKTLTLRLDLLGLVYSLERQ